MVLQFDPLFNFFLLLMEEALSLGQKRNKVSINMCLGKGLNELSLKTRNIRLVYVPACLA